MSADESQLDWTHLPPGIVELSLWSCLHDAKLQAIRSDALEQTVTLEFNSAHLFNSESGLRFLFRIGGVTSVRAVVWRSWPGTFPSPAGMTREENSRLVDEWENKGRAETLNWGDLEASVNADFFDIFEASLVTSKSQIALQIKGMLLEDDVGCELSLRGSSLTVTRSDGNRFSLEELIALGDGYWNEFARRRSA